MNFPSCMLISILVLSIYTIVISGENASSKKKTPKKEDKIVIDDLEEGSGYSNPDGRNDMVFSGSGYGPDDEDAESEEHDNRNGLPNNMNAKLPETRAGKIIPTLPMPKSTAAPTTTTKVEPPSIEIDMKSREPEIKVPVEKQPAEHDSSNNDKAPVDENVSNNNGVYVVNTPDRDRTTSFFAQPGILAAVIGGAVVGLLCAILVVMFIVYRMRKKDEGSYPLEEMKRCPATNPYIKPNHREFFA